MEVLVFKTNVADKKIKRKLFPLLRTINGVLKWNIDLEDADKVLRIEAMHVTPLQIEKTLQQAGFFCRELED